MTNQTVQRIPTGGAQGTDYQIKLLLHCLLTLSKNEGAQFTLDTELRGLGNWDDIVYEQTGENGEISYRFFQLKHKLDQTDKITLHQLSKSKDNDNPYRLLKYFKSYKKLSTHSEYKDKIKDVVLFTNIDVKDVLKAGGLLEEITDEDPLLDFKLSDAQVTENNGRPARYRLGRNFPEFGDLANASGDPLERLFRKHLVLAVNQPNEKLLTKLIMNSLDSTRIAQATFSYSTKSAETAYRVLESRMREFYKRPEGSTCNKINLTINDAIKWKGDIEVELGKLFNVGCYYAYHKKLDRIHFEPSFVQVVRQSHCIEQLEQQLAAKTLLFYIKTDEDPLITALCVRAALKGENEREQFLFTTLKSAFDKEIENDWKSLAVRMVIVDESGSIDNIRRLCRDITNQQAAVDFVKGFIVLISQKDITTDSGENSYTDSNQRKSESRKTQRKRMNPTGTEFDSSKQEVAKRAKNAQPCDASKNHKMNLMESLTAHKFQIGDIEWKDLSKETQCALKSKIVEFQGRQVTLGQFNTMEQIINSKTLVQLVEHMDIPIKIAAECFDQDANVYVPRTVNCRLLKGKDIQLGSQRFCIDSNDFQDKADYWVKTEEKKRFLLIDSRESIAELRNFVDGERIKSLNENSLNGSIKVAIISDLAGMGKSSMLNSIWTKIKDEDPTKWIVKLDLNDATTTSALGRVNLSQESTNVNNFFQVYFKGISPLENALFDLNLQNGKLIFMLDGFDEIRPEYQEKVLSFLNNLRKPEKEEERKKIDQLWITTRPHLQEKLEDELGQFSLTLMPFSQEDQVNYLIRHWQSGLEQSNPNETLKGQLHKFATQLVDLLSESIRDGQKKFTGVPLQCRMLAESFEHQMKAMDLTLPQRMNLTDLYELFWRRKCEMFLQEKGKAHGASSFAGFIEKLFENTCAMLFEKFALRWMFSEEDFQFLWADNRAVDNLLKPLEDQIHSFGLTVESKGHLPRFIHQTVAEYFVARFLVDHLLKGRHSHKTQFIEFVFDKVLVDESRFHVVKSFINGLLCDSTRRSGIVSRNQELSTVRRVIVVAAKDGHHKIVELVLQGYWILVSCFGQDEIRAVFGDRNELNGQGLLGADEQGWTPIHWATAHSNERVIQVIFDFAMKKGINTTSLLSGDKKFGETPMHRAALLGQCEIMKFIVNNLQNKWIDPRLGRDFKETKGWRWRLLRWSVLYHPNVVKEGKPLSELNVISLLGPDLQKETTVHRAASQGNAESVKILLDAAFHFQLGPDVMLGRGLYGETPLHRAALRGSEHVIEEIFHFFNKCNVSPIKYMGRDHYGETPFHRAASRGRHKVIAFLSKKLRECNTDPLEFLNPDWDHMTPLYRAAENGFDRVVEQILKIYEDTATPVEEIFMADWNGMNPLHWAAANGHARVLHVISEFLQKRNSFPNALFGFDHRKWTLVHWALHGGHDKAIEMSLYLFSNFHTKDRSHNLSHKKVRNILAFCKMGIFRK